MLNRKVNWVLRIYDGVVYICYDVVFCYFFEINVVDWGELIKFLGVFSGCVLGLKKDFVKIFEEV